MSLQITFLGTAASIPTSTRALSSVAVQRQGELFLFDCGEGTQRQMIQAKIGFNRKTRIFITHMHGDHVLGLPGLLQTMSLLGRNKTLQIFGPKGIVNFVEAIITTVEFSLSFTIETCEIQNEGLVLREKEYEIQSTWADHSIPCLAYALIEKPRPGKFHPEKAAALGIPKGPLWSKLQDGKKIKLEDGRIIKPLDVVDPERPGRKIVIVSDTRPSEAIAKFASKADVLIHEATFADDLLDRAEEDKHSTPSGAATIAKKAGVKRLILTHISARYGDPEILLQQAKKVFPNTIIAEDFLRIDVPLKNLTDG
ncbi:MAG: ribonuclease Z [Candidatus Bathyarchaeia archaeon]